MPAVVGIQSLLNNIVMISAIIIAVGFVLKLLRQPSVVSYIVVGVLLGPSLLGVVKNISEVSTIGSLGLVLLLFFIGMEMSLPSLIANWRISVIGTLLQVIISLLVMWALGTYTQWSLPRIVMMGFVLALSSTAVILKLLEEWREMHTRVGQNVIGILLTQDVLVVVMLIIMGYLDGSPIEGHIIIKQVIGAILIGIILAVILKKKRIDIPFSTRIARDRELQVFVALLLGFGFALLAELAHLSAALGAFIGGIIVSATRSTKWVQGSLHAFQIIFVSVFFVYVGMIIDLAFLWSNIGLIMGLVGSVFLLNTAINGFVFLAFRIPWRDSFYGGALLSQIGEFSFVIGALGFSQGIIGKFTFQLIISTIALSLFLSPIWIFTIKKMLRCRPDTLQARVEQ